MNLEQNRFLIIDCQTTGMRPSVGHILEIAWAWASADDSELNVESFLVKLPPETWIPNRVYEITGIKESELVDGIEIEEVRELFLKSISSAGIAEPTALIHYSQFEEPFLRAFLQDQFADGRLPFDFLCTHKLAKKLFPTVPSRNIRGLTGFFGSRIGEIKRAHQHVRATHVIWKALCKSLNDLALTNLADVRAYLQAPSPKAKKGEPKAKPVAYEYRIERAKRLAIPDRPGIYKMKDKDGSILYVGKATSLRDRVNSYFRGKKGRDPRKLEMMAQVWDLETIECGSAIEAALVESDEIKRLDPPYNVSLKSVRRAMMFYSKDFESESVQQDVDHPIGPFRRFNSIDHLRILVRGLLEGLIVNVFHQPIDPEVLEAGYAMFIERHAEFGLASPRLRDHVAIGLWLTRKMSVSLSEIEAGQVIGSEIGAEAVDSGSGDDGEAEYTAEDIAGKFERLYLRAAASYLRSKMMTSLLWSDVRWTEKGEEKTLAVRQGKIASETATAMQTASQTTPWEGLQISDYDRMSILLSEIARFPHEIETLR